jgi:hypothetical protein
VKENGRLGALVYDDQFDLVRFRPNADADQHLVKGRALARPSERSERFEPVVMHVLLAVSLNDTG